MHNFVFSESSFQLRLEQARVLTKSRSLKDYWLNSDGTLDRKASWLGRFIRWIQNLMFNKTANDIWHAFLRAQQDFKDSLSLLSSPISENPPFKQAAKQFALERGRRLCFVAEFLLSRKRAFDRYKKSNPVVLPQLKILYGHFKALGKKGTCATMSEEKSPQEATMEKGFELGQAQKIQLQKLAGALDILRLPNLSDKTLSQKPPKAEPRISPEIAPKEYGELALSKLMELYDQTELSKKDSGLVSEMIEACDSGKILVNFCAVATAHGLPGLKIPFKWPIAPLLKKDGSLNTIGDIQKLFAHLSGYIYGYLQKSGKKKEGLVFKTAELLRETLEKFEPSQQFSRLIKLCLLRSNFASLIKNVRERNPDVFGINSAIYNFYYDQIELFLKNILYEIMHTPKLSCEKKRRVFHELSVAGGHCPARWLEESKRQFISLRLKDNSLLEYYILQQIQGLKEDILLELFQNGAKNVEYHILDSIRKELGGELGLDDSTVHLDPFTPKLSPANVRLIKRLFIAAYTPEKILRAMKERINLSLKESYNPSLFSYLAKRIEEKCPEIEDPAEHVMQHFMRRDYQTISKTGVQFLLTDMGIFEE